MPLLSIILAVGIAILFFFFIRRRRTNTASAAREITQESVRKSIQEITQESLQEITQEIRPYDSAPLSLSVRYSKNDEHERILVRLNDYFTREKPFRNAVRLVDVAQELNVSRHYLSKILNKIASKNFSQFVNEYRVREACSTYLSEPSLSIEEAGKRSGFRNYASFSGAFRYTVGYTPKLWANEIDNKIKNNEEVNLNDYFK